MSIARIWGLLAATVALAGSANADTIVVNQIGFTFQPQDIVIDEGDTVMWVWNSNFHTTTEGVDDSVDPTDAWHQQLDSSQPSLSVTFDAAFLAANPRPGDLYPYVCAFHLAGFNMVGSVQVIAAGGGPTLYCTAKTSSAGCVTTMSTSNPSAQPVSGANDYSALADSVQGGKNGIMFFGVNGQAGIPFNNGTLCMNPPLGRAPIQFSFGSGANTCDGSFAQVLNDGGATNPNLDRGPGTMNWVQWWYRDPQNGAGSLGTSLSDAAELTYQ